MALTSSHEEIGKDSGRITEIKPVIDIYNLEEINYPSEQDDWKKNKKKIRAIALNIFILKIHILHTFQNITKYAKSKLFF